MTHMDEHDSLRAAIEQAIRDHYGSLPTAWLLTGEAIDADSGRQSFFAFASETTSDAHAVGMATIASDWYRHGAATEGDYDGD